MSSPTWTRIKRNSSRPISLKITGGSRSSSEMSSNDSGPRKRDKESIRSQQKMRVEKRLAAMCTLHVSEQGVTILEVLIAFMVVGVIVLVVFTTFGIGLRAAALAGSMRTATSLAEEALVVVAASPCGSSFIRSVPSPPEGSELGRYYREIGSHRAPGADMWSFTVTVTWSQERALRRISLTTLRHVSLACTIAPQWRGLSMSAVGSP